MHFNNFSRKQEQLLCWWMPESPYHNYDGIICDGAVRSGKTLCMSMSFILWAMASFDGQTFAICGKTIHSCVRNVVTPLQQLIPDELKMHCHFNRSLGCMDVTSSKAKNRFYIFGGKDESSAALIQGVTLAGILLDEVALMPKSFVDQALARCSVTGSKFWFNCNPEGPQHWFYTDWIAQAAGKGMLHIHFTMQDNPSLSPRIRKRYENLYTGVFYERFILGNWVMAEGLIYPHFNPELHVTKTVPTIGTHYISIDYGTLNPCSMGKWRVTDGKAYRIAEVYHDGRKTGKQLTDEDYCNMLEQLAGDDYIQYVFVDPSAASFIAAVRRRGKFNVKGARNDVLDGIRVMARELQAGRLLIHESCKASIREFGLYRWDEKTQEDRPIKENDHAMDEIRYFCMGVSDKQFRHFWGGVKEIDRNRFSQAAGIQCCR